VQRPNILYLHSHDTGRYVQPYGLGVPTPNIQRLAERGVLFRQAFCAAPTCSPSRAALLTGQCAHSSGMLGLAHRGFALADLGQHIVHTLRAAGYRSALAGVQHVADDPKEIGYDDILANKDWLAQDIAAAASRFLESKPHQPFFLSVGFFETHREFREPGPEDIAQYCQPPLPLPDTRETRQDMAGFKASARALDQAIGTLLDTLERAGLADRTLVICTTDHGLAFPLMKCNLTDHGIGVMLIMRGPGGFAGGQVCDGMVSHIDLFPTLCDLLEIDQPPWLQGRSIMPMLRGEVENVNDEIFAEVSYHAAYEPQRAVRTQRWKYIRRFVERDGPVLPNCDDGPSKAVLLNHGWQGHAPALEQLYDLVFDPVERHNLAPDHRYAEVLSDMRGRLDRWMQTTDDPLLLGPVTAPRGARVNDPDGLSPSEATRSATL
jgi:N-sulfoglucosamine sulfohydrolase